MDVDGDDAPEGATEAFRKVKTEVGEEERVAGEGSRTAGAGRRVKVEGSPAVGKKGEVDAGQRKSAADGTEKEGGDSGVVLAMALLLIRHAMQDTFGKGAVTVAPQKKAAAVAAAAADKKGSSDKATLSAEIKIDTDGAAARVRVFVAPRPPASTQRLRPDAAATGGGGGGVDGPAAGEAAWRCEVVECTRDSLRSQIMLLVERLRAAVSKS